MSRPRTAQVLDRPPAAVTFDVTGTLIHCPRLGQIYAEVLTRHGIPATAVEVERLFPVVWQELDCSVELGSDRFSSHPEGARGWWRWLLERLCEHLEAPAPTPFAAAELYNRFAHAEAWELFPDVAAALDRLADSGLRLGVVSNWDERLPGLLAELDLARCFDAVIYSAEIGLEKPDPRLFLYALDQLGVEPEEAVHVGDSRRRDVEGALATGMGAIQVDRRGRSRDALGDLKRLPELLDSAARGGA